MKTKMKIDKDKLASNIADGLDLKTDMGREIVKVALECIKLFDDKQLDYGSSNIAASGEIGVAVRIQDKASRMRHILLRGASGVCTVVDLDLEEVATVYANDPEDNHRTLNRSRYLFA